MSECAPFGEQKDYDHLVDDGQKKRCDVEPRHDEEIVNAILEPIARINRDMRARP